MTLDCEKYFRKPGYRCLAIPIALQFTDELDPTGGFTTGLLQPSQASFVRFNGCSRNAIDHRINLKPRGNGVEGRMHKANLGPQRRHNQLLPTCRLDGTHEILVFPGVD